MRVVMVSPFDPAPPSAEEAAGGHVGGVERVLHRMAHEVAARGHDVTLLCSARRAGVDWDGEVRVVRLRRAAMVMRAPVAAFASHLPREADLVHVPATYPFTTPAVLRAARRRGLPAVLDFHFEPSPGDAFGRAAARAYGMVGPRAYGLAEAVAVRSLGYARSAPSLRGLDARLRVVPNGVDAQRFHPRGAARPGGHVLVVGRLVPYKGVEVLLRALAAMEAPPPLVVAGDGPLRAPLEALAARLGVRAEFLGRVPDAALPALYRGARLTVLPSVNGQEAFGIALVESMACGTPVVASRLPGVEEVALEGGVLAPPGDAPALARCLERALRAELPRGEPLAARVRARYAWPVVAGRLVEVYEEALGRPAARPAPEVMQPARPRGHALL